MDKADFERRLRRILSEYLSATNTRTMTPVVRVLFLPCVLVSVKCSYGLDVVVEQILLSISFVLEKTHSADSHLPAWKRKSE